MSNLISCVPLDVLPLLRACVRGKPDDLQYLAKALDHPDQLSAEPPNLIGLLASLIREDGSDEVSEEVRTVWAMLA